MSEGPSLIQASMKRMDWRLTTLMHYSRRFMVVRNTYNDYVQYDAPPILSLVSALRTRLSRWYPLSSSCGTRRRRRPQSGWKIQETHSLHFFSIFWVKRVSEGFFSFFPHFSLLINIVRSGILYNWGDTKEAFHLILESKRRKENNTSKQIKTKTKADWLTADRCPWTDSV